MKKGLWIAIVIVVVLGMAANQYWDYVQTLRDKEFYSGNGRLEATEIYIASKLAGRIDKILVKEGDLVKEGQVLAKMRTTELEAQLEQSKAQIDVYKAKVEAAQATLLRRQSAFDAAKSDFDRESKLLKSQTISQKKWEDADMRLKSATAELAEAKAEISNNLAGVKAAEANCKVIEAYLEDCVLKAPREGRIQYLIAHEGEVLAAGGRVLNLADLTDVYITFFLPETVAGATAIGSETQIVLDANREAPIPAKVSYVASVAQFTPKTVETKVERQKMMFRVKAHIDYRLLKKYIEYVKTGMPGVAYVKIDPKADWANSPIADIWKKFGMTQDDVEREVSTPEKRHILKGEKPAVNTNATPAQAK